MCTFLNLNREVKSWAVCLFFAIIKTPEVSLSNLWTENGFVPWNISLFANISTKFFFDFVPPWTDIPALLFKTIKSSLLSMIRSSLDFITSMDGLNCFLSCLIFSLKSKLKSSILSFVLILKELFIFFLFILIFPNL